VRARANAGTPPLEATSSSLRERENDLDTDAVARRDASTVMDDSRSPGFRIDLPAAPSQRRLSS